MGFRAEAQPLAAALSCGVVEYMYWSTGVVSCGASRWVNTSRRERRPEAAVPKNKIRQADGCGGCRRSAGLLYILADARTNDRSIKPSISSNPDLSFKTMSDSLPWWHNSIAVVAAAVGACDYGHHARLQPPSRAGFALISCGRYVSRSSPGMSCRGRSCCDPWTLSRAAALFPSSAMATLPT